MAVPGELSLSRSTVKRAVQDLKAAGYLEAEQRWRGEKRKSSLLFRLLNNLLKHTRGEVRPGVAYGMGLEAPEGELPNGIE